MYIRLVVQTVTRVVPTLTCSDSVEEPRNRRTSRSPCTTSVQVYMFMHVLILIVVCAVGMSASDYLRSNSTDLRREWRWKRVTGNKGLRPSRQWFLGFASPISGAHKL